MFDIDNTLTRHGLPLNSRIILDLLLLCKESGVLTATNTNRPIARPVELSCSRIQFDLHYGNRRSFFGIPYIGCFFDWIFSREYVSKIDNMKKAEERSGCRAILLDDNIKTVQKAQEAGFIAYCVPPEGIGADLLSKIQETISRSDA